MAAQIFLPRLAERAVEEALADTPVVLVLVFLIWV
jgi:hypothetical protein